MLTTCRCPSPGAATAGQGPPDRAPMPSPWGRVRSGFAPGEWGACRQWASRASECSAPSGPGAGTLPRTPGAPGARLPDGALQTALVNPADPGPSPPPHRRQMLRPRKVVGAEAGAATPPAGHATAPHEQPPDRRPADEQADPVCVGGSQPAERGSRSTSRASADRRGRLPAAHACARVARSPPPPRGRQKRPVADRLSTGVVADGPRRQQRETQRRPFGRGPEPTGPMLSWIRAAGRQAGASAHTARVARAHGRGQWPQIRPIMKGRRL